MESRDVRPTRYASVLLAGGILFTLASLQVRMDLPVDVDAPIPILVTGGVLLSVYGLFIKRSSPFFENIPERLAGWFGVSNWQAALLLLGLPFSILTHYAAGEAHLMHSPMIAWAAWLAAILCVVVGGWHHESFNLAARRNTILTALGFVAVAWLVRGFTPEAYPIVFSGNEGSVGIWAVDILNGKFDNPFRTGWYAFPGLYYFIPAASISLLGPTIAAVRIPSIIAGSLTVGAAYLAGRVLYGRTVGALAAILLAGFGAHIQFSRFGLNNIWDGLFFVIVVTAVVYAWRQESRMAFLLAGLAMGLAQYFYVTARVLPLMLLGWLAGLYLIDSARFKRLVPGVFLMGLTALVIVLPLAWFYVHNPGRYIRPFTRASQFDEATEASVQMRNLLSGEQVIQNTWLGMRSFAGLPVSNSWYGTQRPFLWQPLAALFFAGLAFAVLRPRESHNLLVLLWLIAFVFISGFGEGVPAPQRMVPVTPACLMLAAYGLSQVAGFVGRVQPRFLRLSSALALLLCVFLALKDIAYYYTEYAPESKHFYSAESHSLIAQRLGTFLQTQPHDLQVIFFGHPRMGFYSIPSLQYLAPQIEGLDMIAPWGSPDNPQPTSNRLIFVILAAHADQIPLVQADYPGGELQEEKGLWGEPLYYYYIPAP